MIHSDCAQVTCSKGLGFTEDEIDVAYDVDGLVSRFEGYLNLNPEDIMYDNEFKADLDHIRNQSHEMVVKCDSDTWLVKMLDSQSFAVFYRNYLHMLCHEQGRTYFSNPRNRVVANFIKLQMAIWNVTHLLYSFNFRLNATNIPNDLFNLLKLPQLSPSISIKERNIRIVLHSVISILHNIVRHIPQVRGSYRKLDGVRILMTMFNGLCDSTQVKTGSETNSVLESENSYLSIRTAALLFLSVLVDESENEALHTTDVHIIYLLNALSAALDSITLYSATFGLTAIELLDGLQTLAGPDPNKLIILRNNGLKVIENALTIAVSMRESYGVNTQVSGDTATTTDADELASETLKLLWALIFVPDSHRHLASGSSFRRLFEQFATDRLWSTKCHRAAQGILWTLTSVQNKTSSDLSIETLMSVERRCPNRLGHLMISYQHSTQAVMLKVRQALIDRGYSIWMDVDYMRGSFVDAMATAIQNSSGLILGVSQAFKNSPHCRQEVKYAYSLGIPMYPMQLEPNFTADGWLGLLLATIIYVPLTDESLLDSAMEQLTYQLGSLGHSSSFLPHQSPALPPASLSDSLNSSTMSYGSQLGWSQNDRDSQRNRLWSARHFRDHSETPDSQSNITSLYDKQRSVDTRESIQGVDYFSNYIKQVNLQSNAEYSFLDWTKTDVANWLHMNNLSAYCDGFSDMDGATLLELVRMRETAPESLNTSLYRDLGMRLTDQLRLYRALTSLTSTNSMPVKPPSNFV